MKSWESQIEQDLAWRETEMGVLKLLLASSPTGSDRQRALLRACSAMLYAHYEGFSKFCWTILLSSISAQGCPVNDLIEPLAKRAMSKVFKTLRGDLSAQSLWRFATIDFRMENRKPAEFFDEIDTESNLWPNIAESINDSVGLDCSVLKGLTNEMKQLVARRNRIAHGEKMEVADMRSFQKLEHAAILVMHELAISVVDCLHTQSYLHHRHDPEI